MVLGVSNNRLTCMQGQKILQFSENIHFSASFFQTPPSHYPFISHVMPDQAAFVSAVLLCVQHYQGNPVYFYCFKSGTLWQRMNLHFHSDNAKRPTSVHVNMKLFGIRFKKNLFQWFRVDSFFWETITVYTNNFIHGALSDIKLCRLFSWTYSCVTHCTKAHLKKSIIRAH